MKDFGVETSLLGLSNETLEAFQASAVERDFEDALLAALASMAVRSHRRQADLIVATRRAALFAGPERLQIALSRLVADGSVEAVVPLADGGVLVSVTSRGIDRLNNTSRRHVVGGG